jgi:hypothetical protein
VKLEQLALRTFSVFPDPDAAKAYQLGQNLTGQAGKMLRRPEEIGPVRRRLIDHPDRFIPYALFYGSALCKSTCILH